MKKIVSIMVAMMLIASGISVCAESSVSHTMEQVLVNVKQKVDIPEHFTEFVPYTSQIGGKTNYSFMWQSQDKNAYIEVLTDDMGRISSYYFFDNSLKSDKKLTTLSKADILTFAETFLQKTVPEVFVDKNDTLTFDEDSWSVSNLVYNLSYQRMRKGIEVKDNYASVRVVVYDDVAYIKNMNLSFVYDAEFEDCDETINNYEEKYKNAFPIELIYRDEYLTFKTEKDEKDVVLVYRHKDNKEGYILASTGEVVTEDKLNEIFGSAGGGNFVNMESSADSTLRKEMLTDKEREELEKIAGLISKADAEKILKKLPYIGFDNNLKLNNYSINERDGEYIISLSYETEDGQKYISASFNGKTGELINLYNRKPGETNKDTLSEAQKESCNKKVEQFLKTVASDRYAECIEVGNEVYGKIITRDFDRVVNDVRYIDDGIYVEFDTQNNIVTSYRLDFEDSLEFGSTENIVGGETAHNTLIEKAPLKKIYLHTNGKYQVCYTMSRYGVEICAATGEEYKSPIVNNDSKNYQYSDLEGHWAKEKIEKLAEIQIGFNHEKFNPDEAISQYDLLRLFAAGVRYSHYLDFGEDELYRILVDEGIITDGEKNPENKVTRENAFEYMVKIDGLDKVAKLQDIFKVEYADGNLISEGKIGYPAILTGMKVICGSGGRLRPQDKITRAEAAVMVYNYMTANN